MALLPREPSSSCPPALGAHPGQRVTASLPRMLRAGEASDAVGVESLATLLASTVVGTAELEGLAAGLKVTVVFPHPSIEPAVC